jgi:hypothetical protein
MGSQLHPQPDVHYTSSKVFVQGDEAALLGQYGKDGFLSMRFVKEDTRWKIKDFAFLAIRRTPRNRFMPSFRWPPEPSSARGRRGRTSHRHSIRRMRPSMAFKCGQLTMSRFCIFGSNRRR